MSLEQWAFNNLAKDLPGLRKNGLKQTVFDALSWCGWDQQDFDDVWTRHNRPHFVPDATRWRKCVFNHARERTTACVELWEIEDWNKLTEKKINAIDSWFHFVWDGFDDPMFELWVCDRWGNSRHRVLSMAEEHYEPPVLLIDCELAKEAA